MEGSSSANLIPNAENAVVDIRKLRDYCLNPEHDGGKQKARLFSSILGITTDNAEELRQILVLRLFLWKICFKIIESLTL